METDVCINYLACPIFSGILLDKETTTKNYKKQFCEAGPAGWSKCKRFLVKEKMGKCPSNLLPNSFKTVEEIISTMQ